MIALKMNLISRWYSGKISELALNNDHSITHSFRNTLVRETKNGENLLKNHFNRKCYSICCAESFLYVVLYLYKCRSPALELLDLVHHRLKWRKLRTNKRNDTIFAVQNNSYILFLFIKSSQVYVTWDLGS